MLTKCIIATKLMRKQTTTYLVVLLVYLCNLIFQTLLEFRIMHDFIRIWRVLSVSLLLVCETRKPTFIPLSSVSLWSFNQVIAVLRAPATWFQIALAIVCRHHIRFIELRLTVLRLESNAENLLVVCDGLYRAKWDKRRFKITMKFFL